MTAELVIFVGLQASGKTTFFEQRFRQTHVLVSKDLLRNNSRPGRRQRELVTTALAEGKSIVVDNTNATPEDRRELVGIGRAAGARVVAYVFTAALEGCLRRNAAREGRSRVPDRALYVTRSRLVWPTADEGHDAMYRVELVPGAGFVVRPFAQEQEPGGAL
ncbi:MAG: ATP-binding protein [Candidatus Riflebacteria bacterium]|nr:ATP-binding protein [Candidatus Riflebacteria bacterium]